MCIKEKCLNDQEPLLYLSVSFLTQEIESKQ